MGDIDPVVLYACALAVTWAVGFYCGGMYVLALQRDRRGR